MAETSKTPGVPKELLDYLIAVYPDRCPSPEMSDREVWMAAGRASVVRKLRQIHETQFTRALESQ